MEGLIHGGAYFRNFTVFFYLSAVCFKTFNKHLHVHVREPEKVSTGQQPEHDEKNITYQASPSVPFASGLIEFMVPKQFLRSLQFLNIRLTKMSTRNTCVRAV